MSLENKIVLVTGMAGFIEVNLIKRLYLNILGITVISIDNKYFVDKYRNFSMG